jgi:UDP-N-acetylglucosamine--N-acetylmuramyl-(pentapeptide) pyrophosphoryl-undecaprenol N-acetylglucosamine transferase
MATKKKKPQEKLKLNRRIVVTGGGSGGHTNTALAFISSLQKKYTKALDNILYIGGDLAMEGDTRGKSLEHKLLEKTDIDFEIIRAGKLQRYFGLTTIKLLFKTVGGFVDSSRVLRKYKPDLIFSTGGYVTVPVCIVGWILKIPVYVHEQTINIGLANKIASKFATKVFVTFPQSEKYFPKGKTIHTGNILREDLLKPKKKGEIVEIIRKMKKQKEKYPIVYISGGSLGSHVINATIRDMIPYIVQHYQIILQTGEHPIYRDYEKIVKEKSKLTSKVQERFFPVKYIDSCELGFVYQNMDLFIGRAGANTVYEIGLFKKKSIFIPIPWAGKNEQYENAKILEKTGLSKIIPEGELISDLLFDEMNKLMKKNRKPNEEKLEKIFIKEGIKTILKEMDL